MIKCKECGSESMLEYTSCEENTEYACGKCGHHTIVEHTAEEKERYKKERGLFKVVAYALFNCVTLFNKKLGE
jgi:DNA-directed RNA polymerase subunit M/transcription elongation factor TFIIS